MSVCFEIITENDDFYKWRIVKSAKDVMFLPLCVNLCPQDNL